MSFSLVDRVFKSKSDKHSIVRVVNNYQSPICINKHNIQYLNTLAHSAPSNVKLESNCTKLKCDSFYLYLRTKQLYQIK